MKGTPINNFDPFKILNFYQRQPLLLRNPPAKKKQPRNATAFDFYMS